MTDDADRFGFWAIAERDPDRLAVIEPSGAASTYGELLDRSRAVASGLHGLGLRRGDGLAVVLPNVADFFVAYLAAMESGLYLTPVNSHLAAPEVAHVIADCEAAAVIVHVDLAGLCDPGVAGAGIASERRFVTDGDVDGYVALDDLVSSAPPTASFGSSPGAPMLYTSGTTGVPKGVRRALPDGDPSAVFGGAGHIYCTGFGVTPGRGVHLVCGPLYHAGPMSSATSALQVGHTMVLMGKWSAESCLSAIDRHRVTNTQMVPTMFNRLLALPVDDRTRYDVTSVESVMHTGAPCPVAVKQAFMDWFGPVVYETYGGTESVATIATPRRWLQRPGTVGKPIHGVTVHILDDDGNECAPGEVGAIYIESAAGAKTEYFKDPEKTAGMRRNGSVTLGDVGFLDEDGYLFLRDRKIDMIISGGVNIYPAEIEAALLGCGVVADAAVIGIPDDEWGEQVHAVVELDPAAVADTAEATIKAHCAERLARFKHPRSFAFVDHLPRLPNGKVEKRRLREPFWSDRSSSI